MLTKICFSKIVKKFSIHLSFKTLSKMNHMVKKMANKTAPFLRAKKCGKDNLF